ncbi:unnamed protein product, partial [Coregonus sp. 'balchen']
MRLTEKENETLPIDIVLQTLLAFVLTIYGIVHISGETFDTLRNHPSFYMFNHRGRVLFCSPNQEVSTVPNPQALRLRKLEHLH